jgi:hypothetical protein
MNSEVYSLPEIKGKKGQLHVPLNHHLKNNEVINEDVLKLNTQVSFIIVCYKTHDMRVEFLTAVPMKYSVLSKVPSWSLVKLYQ